MKPRSSNKALIVRNLFSNYAMSFIGMALGFFLVPFLIHKLGKEDYGIVILAESVVMANEIVSVSIRQALSRHATFALSAGDMEGFTRYLFTGRRLLRWAAALALVVGGSISWFFPRLFHVPPADFDSSRILFFVVVLGTVVSLWRDVYWAGLYAAQRHDLINAANSIGLIFRAVGIFALFSILPPEWIHLPQYGAIYLAMTLMQNGSIRYFFRRVFPDVRFSSAHWDPAKVRDILSFSVHTTVSRASGLLYTDVSNVIINLYWGATANSIFAVAGKIPTMFSKIFVEPGYVLTSTFTDFVARGEKIKVRDLLFLYSKGMSILTFPLCTFILFAGEAILTLWVGPGFEQSALILRIYTAHLYLAIPMSMVGSLFNAYGKVKLPSYIGLFSGVMNVALVFALGVGLKFGLPGVAWASVISGLGIGKVCYSVYACRISGISLRSYVWQIVVRPLLVNGLICGAFWFLFFSKQDLGHLNAGYFIWGTLMALACWGLSAIFVLDSKERAHMKDLLVRAARRAGILRKPGAKPA